MSDLHSLFEDDPQRDLEKVVPDPAATDSVRADIAAIVGPVSRPTRERRVQRDVDALTSKVGDRGVFSQEPSAGWRPPEAAVAGNRPRTFLSQSGPVSVVSVVLAVLAIVAVVAVLSFGLYRHLTANPLDGALSSLSEAEADVQNDLQALGASVDLLTQTITSAEALATKTTDVVKALEGKVDAAVLSNTEADRAALAALVASYGAVALPVYERGEVDTSSLVEVSSATDRARAFREQFPDLLSQVRTERAALVGAVDALETRLGELGQRVAEGVADELARNEEASSSTRDAVTAAASTVAQVRGAQLLDPLLTYATAVTNLRAETQTILETPVPQVPQVPRYTPSPPSSPAPTQEEVPPPTEPPPTETPPTEVPTDPSAAPSDPVPLPSESVGA